MDWDDNMHDANSADDSHTAEEEQKLDNDDDHAADYVFDNDDDSDGADVNHLSSSSTGHQSDVSVNQSPDTSAAVAKVEKILADVEKMKADMAEIKQMVKIMIEQMRGTTPRSDGMESSRDTIHASGSLDQIRVTLFDKDEREVAKGSIDITGKICHGRKVVRGERKVYIDEVLVPDSPVYDGPQNGNQTLNAWLEGGFIIWLEGRLKYDM